MKSDVRHRLISLLVFIAIAVIFLPALFNTSYQESDEITELLGKTPAPPPKPDVLNTIRSLQKHSNQLSVITNSSYDDIKSSKPQAFVVQLGNFSTWQNANALMQRLRTQGFTSYIQSHTVADHPFYKVMVGPEIKQSDAQDLLIKLSNVVKLKGVVLPFDPLQ